MPMSAMTDSPKENRMDDEMATPAAVVTAVMDDIRSMISDDLTTDIEPVGIVKTDPPTLSWVWTDDFGRRFSVTIASED